MNPARSTVRLSNKARGADVRRHDSWLLRWARRSIRAIALAVFGLLATGSPASAFIHVVQPSETLAGIAEKYYGKIEYEKILVYANGLELCGGSAIVPGMRLEVPAMEHHRVRAGETWASLARDWLGDESRSGVLARANGAKPWIQPEDGADIVIPYNLRFIVEHRETAPSIAKRFYHELEDAWMLDQYNHIQGKALQRGDVVLVPLTDLPLTEEGKRAARRARQRSLSQGAGHARQVQKKVERELPALEADLRGGRYVEAMVRANRLLALGQATKPQLARLHHALTVSYTALGAKGLAADACEKWLLNDPSVVLEPMATSPKILEVCRSAEANK